MLRGASSEADLEHQFELLTCHLKEQQALLHQCRRSLLHASELGLYFKKRLSLFMDDPSGKRLYDAYLASSSSLPDGVPSSLSSQSVSHLQIMKKSIPVSERREQLHDQLVPHLSSTLTTPFSSSSNTTSSSSVPDPLSRPRKRKRSPQDDEDELCTILSQRIKTNSWPTFYRNARPFHPEITSSTELYCYCQRPSFGEMVLCNECNQWFHFLCINMNKPPVTKRWFCHTCRGLLKLD